MMKMLSACSGLLINLKESSILPITNLFMRKNLLSRSLCTKAISKLLFCNKMMEKYMQYLKVLA